MSYKFWTRVSQIKFLSSIFVIPRSSPPPTSAAPSWASWTGGLTTRFGKKKDPKPPFPKLLIDNSYCFPDRAPPLSPDQPFALPEDRSRGQVYSINWFFSSIQVFAKTQCCCCCLQQFWRLLLLLLLLFLLFQRLCFQLLFSDKTPLL